MVWGLFPVDPLPGEDSYYFFSKGTYKVGRKGCDVIINKDKGVSRIHAEIVIDAMISLDYPHQKNVVKPSKVRIKDCSKYGTFITKHLGSKEKVHEFPNKELSIEDGNLVSFGTGSATYRFSFVPLVFYLCQLESVPAKKLQEKISSIGASISSTLSPECTHVLFDDFTSINDDVIDSIVAKRPLVTFKWVEAHVEKAIGTEILSCSPFAPTFTLEDVSVKVADTKTLENCLQGYTFVLESTQKYKHKDRLRSLVEAVGGKVVPAEQFSPSSQGLEDEGSGHTVRVIPAGLADSTDCLRSVSYLHRVNEISLICATLSGHLDPCILLSPPVLVTSSCSTDETVIADSDPEVEITSVNASIVQKIKPVEEDEDEGKVAVQRVKSIEHQDKVTTNVYLNELIANENEGDVSREDADARSTDDHVTHLGDTNSNVRTREHKVDECESGNSDIIYSQDLIVRDTGFLLSGCSPIRSEAVNFKRFRKMGTQSGNSFTNLIPFSKYPYKNSEYEADEVVESVKEEKKRKQMEAVAEELFNNDKVRRRAAAGSLHGLLARS